MTTSPTPVPFVVRRPEDLVAYVPLALGFVPEASVVMLTFLEHGPGFHARVDLPEESHQVDRVVESLVRPALKHRVRSVVLVVYDDDTDLAEETAWALRDSFGDVDVEVVEVLRVHAGRWFALLPGRPPATYAGVPFDLTTHPFTARAVLDGRVTHASREALRATLRADAAAVRRTEVLLRTVAPLQPGQLRERVESWLRDDGRPSDEEVAALAVSLPLGVRRDEAWAWLDRGTARAAVELWADVVRRVPDTHVASPAAVLAFTAWLAGDGALAWCAVDRCVAVEPDHSLARLVSELLEGACAPDLWDRLRARTDRPDDPAA